MAVMRNAALAIAILAAGSAFAQTAQEHETHHPETAAAPTPPAGMQGPGMSGAGMMDHMRQMMGMMSMMGPGMRPGAEHIEGRLAFLKAELKISDAQAAEWNAFADAVRANAKAMAATHQQVMAQGAPKTLPDRLALEQKAMTAHLDALNKTAAALDKLYGSLDADQKKTADTIIVGPMGMPLGMM